MIPGLSAADSAAYVAALQTDCAIAWRIQQLDLNHNLVGTIETADLDGQINMIAADGDGITKTVQCSFLDPDHMLRLDNSSPSAGVGGLDRLLKFESFVYSEAETRWIKAPAGVYWPGGGDDLTRNGDTISVSAAGKESLHLRYMPASYVKKGTYVLTAIRRILEASGETRFRFPTGIRTKLTKHAHFGGGLEERQPWVVARKLARQLDLQLFYDLTGYACLRPLPGTPIWKLIEAGPGANTLTRVKTTTNLREVRNRVYIRGTKAKKVVTGIASSAASHPTSAQSLKIDGKPLVIAHYEDAPDLRYKSQVNRRAASKLAEFESQYTRVETTALPFWHFQPYEVWSLQPSGAEAFNHRPLDVSAPMGPSDVGMTVGYTHRVRKATAGRLRK